MSGKTHTATRRNPDSLNPFVLLSFLSGSSGFFVLIFLFCLLFLIFSISQPFDFLSRHFLCLYMRISPFVLASILISYTFSLSFSHFSFSFGSHTPSYSLLPSLMPLLSIALFFRLFSSVPSLPRTTQSLYRFLSVHCNLLTRVLSSDTPCPTLTALRVRIFSLAKEHAGQKKTWGRDPTCEDWIRMCR